jgi:hypothetical protein
LLSQTGGTPYALFPNLVSLFVSVNLSNRKDVIDMRRLIFLRVLAFTLMLLLAGTTQAESPLIGQMELDFYLDNPIWRGSITGDIAGEIFFTNVGTGKRGNQEPGNTLTFSEVWLITDEQGNMLLTGTDEGVVSPNSEYRMNGVVTDAAPQWSHLIGRNVHASGYITWDPTGLPVTAPGTFRIN